MRVRSALLSTVLCGSILALSMTASTMAGAAETFKPQGNWAVSKVDSKQPGGSPYCALARRFDNGSILTFARNIKDETSMAVDLPRGIFKTGENYTVMLDADTGETRSYEVQPVSERSIIVRMGKDEKFYTALGQSGKLGVSVAGQSFMFSLSDMQAGNQDLSSCLGEQPVKSAAATVAAPVEVSAPVQQKKQDVSVPTTVAQVDNKDIQRLKEENMRLRASLEDERRSFENKYMDQGGSTSPAAAELNEKLALLEKENRELRLQSGSGAVSKAVSTEPVSCTPDMSAQTAISDETKKLKEENSRLKADIESQRQKMASVEMMNTEKSSADLKAAQDRAVAAEARVATLQGELTKLQESGEKDTVAGGSRVAVLQEEIARLRAQNTQSADMDSRVATLKDRIGKLEEENQVLKASIETQKSAPDTEKDKLATVRQLKEMEIQMSSVKAERDRLAAEMEKIKNSGADDRVKISSDNWNLEQATQRFNETEREIRRLGVSLEQERAKCAVEKKDLEYMLFDPKIATQQQTAKLTALEEELAQMKQKTGADPAQQQVSAYETRVKELEQKLADSKLEADQLRRSAATETSVQDQTDLVNTLRQEIAGLNARMAMMQSEIKPSARGGEMEMTTQQAEPVVNQSIEKKIPVESMAAVVSPDTGMMRSDDIESLLHKAGLEISGKVQNLEGVSDPNRVAYRWENGDLFGTAEQKGLQSAAQFDQYVRNYIASVKSHCTGEFKVVPALEEVQGSKRVSAHQLTCLDKDGSGAAAALLFYTLDGKMFTTIAYEAAPQSMGAVTGARDKIAEVLRDSKTAAK